MSQRVARMRAPLAHPGYCYGCQGLWSPPGRRPKDYDLVNPLETILGHQWTDLCPKEWCDSHDLP
jgi:hypothetical protein